MKPVRTELLARLVGGPCDGEVVRVLGIRWERPVAFDIKTGRGTKAVYRWDNRDGELVGKFAGLERWL